MTPPANRISKIVVGTGPGAARYKPPMTNLAHMSALFTTMPPLANVAYGASAPPDGTLLGVTPVLTTITTSVSSTLETVTSIAKWEPTSNTASFNPASASLSAAHAAQSALTSPLCMGRGPGACSAAEKSFWVSSSALMAEIGALLVGFCL